jgi:hypothetical protein
MAIEITPSKNRALAGLAAKLPVPAERKAGRQSLDAHHWHHDYLKNDGSWAEARKMANHGTSGHAALPDRPRGYRRAR